MLVEWGLAFCFNWTCIQFEVPFHAHIAITAPRVHRLDGMRNGGRIICARKTRLGQGPLTNAAPLG